MKDIKEEIKKLYQKLQDEAGFKVGDKVKIIRAAITNECGWANSWLEDRMTPYVGKIGKVTSIDADGQGINVSVNDKTVWDYPYFVLEKIEEIVYAEILTTDETWTSSVHTTKEIRQKAKYVTNSQTHDYYSGWGILYRIKRDE